MLFKYQFQNSDRAKSKNEKKIKRKIRKMKGKSENAKKHQ